MLHRKYEVTISHETWSDKNLDNPSTGQKISAEVIGELLSEYSFIILCSGTDNLWNKHFQSIIISLIEIWNLRYTVKISTNETKRAERYYTNQRKLFNQLYYYFTFYILSPPYWKLR